MAMRDAAGKLIAAWRRHGKVNLTPAVRAAIARRRSREGGPGLDGSCLVSANPVSRW
jgi:hypothetical protein